MLAVPVYFSLPQTKGNESGLNCPHPTVVILLLFCASSCCAVPVYFSLPQTKGDAGVLNCPHRAVVMLSLCHVSGCRAVPVYFSLPQTKGELSQERRESHEAALNAFQKLHSSASALAVSSFPFLPSSLPGPLEGPHIFLIMPTIAVFWLSEIHTL